MLNQYFAPADEPNTKQRSKKPKVDIEFNGNELIWGDKRYEAKTELGNIEFRDKSLLHLEGKKIPEGIYRISFLSEGGPKLPTSQRHAALKPKWGEQLTLKDFEPAWGFHTQGGDFEPAWGFHTQEGDLEPNWNVPELFHEFSERDSLKFVPENISQNTAYLIPYDRETHKNCGSRRFLLQHPSTPISKWGESISVSPLFFTDLKTIRDNTLYIRVKYNYDRTNANTNRLIPSDKDIARKQKRLHSKILIDVDHAEGRMAFCFSHLKDYRIQGQFKRNLQGDHTIAYSVIVATLETLLSNKTIIEFLDQTRKIHHDLKNLYHLYAYVDDHYIDAHLKEKEKYVDVAYNQMHSNIYQLEGDIDQETFNLQGNGAGEFLKCVRNYIFHYLAFYQSIPFSAVYVAPGEGSGGRGEGATLQLLNDMNTGMPAEADTFYSLEKEKECLVNFSKIFDERAINTLLRKPQFRSKTAVVIGFQIIGLLSILEAYPVAKKFFFKDPHLLTETANLKRSEFQELEISKKDVKIDNWVDNAKLENIAYVIFCYGKKENINKLDSPSREQIEQTYEALQLVAPTRYL